MAYCSYRVRAQQCVRTPGLTQHDPECELVDNKCQVIGQAVSQSVSQSSQSVSQPSPVPIVTSPPTIGQSVSQPTRPNLVSPKPIESRPRFGTIYSSSTPIKTKEVESISKKFTTKNIQDVPEEYRVFISGPVSIHVGKTNDTKYLLFGDQHFSMKGICDMPCSDINVETKDYIHIPKCFDIVALLSTLYKKAEVDNTYVDTYLEQGYVSSKMTPGIIQLVEPTSELVRSIEEFGYLSKIWAVFRNCFLKSECSPHTRFHYSDPRNYIDPHGDKFPIQFDLIIMALLMNLIGGLTTSPNMDQEIKGFDLLIRSIYKPRTVGANRTLDLSDKLFLASIESDDYVNKVTELINGYLYNLSEDIRNRLIEGLTAQGIISKTDGKIQHRARKQLYMLEKEGKGELAQKIRDYLKEDYFRIANASEILLIWNDIYSGYKNFVQNPFLDSMMNFSQKLKNIGEQIHRLAAAGANVMDAYTLARMFRTFPGTNHHPSNLRIVYAGDKHIQKYREFLEQSLNVSFVSYSADPKHQRCLEVDARDIFGPTVQPE